MTEKLTPACLPANVPVPRTIAEKADWMTRHEQLAARARQDDVDLCFVGDSITEWWEGDRAQPVWEACFTGWQAINFGIGGDCTQHVLWRLQHGGIEVARPKVVVLLIGTNNADMDNPARYTPVDIAEAISCIVGEIHARTPETKVLVMGIFPRGLEADTPIRRKIQAINALITTLADGKNVRYLDIGDRYLNADGTLNQPLFWDTVHVSDLGYRVWADAIHPTLLEWLGAPAGGDV